MSAASIAEAVSEQASTWTEEERATGRKLGREVVAENAAHNRMLWSNEVIRLIVDGIHSRTYLPRSSLIAGLRSYNLAHRIKGKGGNQVKRSTITRWLTVELENDLRLEAMQAIIATETAKNLK